MEKDFNNWNEEKKKLHYGMRDELPFHEREVWWSSIIMKSGIMGARSNPFLNI